jgi:Tfp pilus assembly protein PilN
MTAPATEQLEVAGPVATRIDWAPVARVNLLPREILENRRFRHLQVALAFLVVLTLCGAGAALWWSQRTVSDAQDGLDAAQSQTVALQAKQRSYAAVPQTLAALDYAQTARATVMTNDVAWYRYMTDLEDAVPPGVAFSSLTFKIPGPAVSGTAVAPAAQSATADPFAPVGSLGTVSIQGISGTYPKVAQWMDALDKVTGLDVSTLESAIRQTDPNTDITFSGGVTVTDKALSHRYDRKAS